MPKIALSEPGTLADEAYRGIKELLMQQKLSPGQRLIYRDLTEELKMSRTPIINALNRLEREGFLSNTPFCGFQVKPINVKETLDQWSVREALESYAIEQATQLATETDLGNLEKKLCAHSAYMPRRYDPRKLILEAEFHLHIASLTGNDVLVQHLGTILEHQYLRYPLKDLDTRRMARAVDEHRALLERMRARDVPACIQIVRNHIHRGRENILASLSQTG